MSSDPKRRASSSIAFDWTMGVLAALLMGGLLIDGWAHSHGEVDQSFVTPWHGLLYGSMALNGLALGAVALRNRLRGYSIANALPVGYWSALIGVVLFILGGAFDAWWHTVFGIETGISLLISASHLVLAFAGALIMAGPLRSVAAQYGREVGGRRRVGPAVLSLWALVSLVGFFLAYAHPIEDDSIIATMRPSHDAIFPSLYAVDERGIVARIANPGIDFNSVAASPDGRHIVYRVNRFTSVEETPPSDIYIASSDGTHSQRITNSGRHDTYPTWSPDGRWIAYISLPAGTSGNFSLHIMSPDGSPDRTLVDGTTELDSPRWSPDGTKIAYGSRNGLRSMIATVDIATKQMTWLPFTADGYGAAWGERFAFFTRGQLHITTPSGKPIATRQIAGQAPVWSPDGRSMAFLASDAGGVQVFIADADGRHARDVSELSGLSSSSLTWASNTRLLFTAVPPAPPEHLYDGFSLAEGSYLLMAVTIAGALLLLLRRWRAPVGAMTFILTAYALAMAVQTDLYVAAIPAFATGLAADVAIGMLGERARSGIGFYALGFFIPAMFSALYLVTMNTVLHGLALPPNVIVGTPVLTGFAGLLIAFCYVSPLAEPTGGISGARK